MNRINTLTGEQKKWLSEGAIEASDSSMWAILGGLLLTVIIIVLYTLAFLKHELSIFDSFIILFLLTAVIFYSSSKYKNYCARDPKNQIKFLNQVIDQYRDYFDTYTRDKANGLASDAETKHESDQKFAETKSKAVLATTLLSELKSKKYL